MSAFLNTVSNVPADAAPPLADAGAATIGVPDARAARTDVADATSREPLRGTIRKLLPSEWEAFRDHLLRLTRESRRMRFAHSVSDTFIVDYAGRMLDNGSVIYGYVEDNEVKAVAELKKMGDAWGHEAEAAFSVEADVQDRGIGTDLMGRVIRAARNRGVTHLYMSCLAENTKMQAIARKHEAELKFEYGEVVGEILPTSPNYFSVLAEAVEDRVSYMLAVLDLSARLSKAA